ncbi:MAG TPA: isocitrate/isopropylmalate dehydrogenase family protein [Candidatus Poseidoniaceae archaeon]|nr:MAG TPA: isocitrate/isopropylmalate dehydrogenase family protein [Candidatus Poseidoniales archaeon]DAC60159.1 MAG TPA: isocitrate/isopropylmalate dehydrogenase family protein [Candidatus Poseidoniales archaeon]HII24032.1 isocitrate/isopropylmalate dehydrogenase family protein [Candidatus Poseidoniaceae archaeon]HII50246.1 isocitrate/isopropylmalate dehydrogenase family protein [Candidatus Poseidoniaceae archaeon]|tara:strand:+ start:1816 stop:2997 length:1182 start_codon:yes stop_codon:yes gene_type:complete
MSDYNIAILPGDGTGREVALEAQKILETIVQNTNIGFEFTEIPCGGQNYKETGEEWAEGSFEFCRDEADAIFLGAIGHPGSYLPNGDLAGGSVILGLRSGLDLYANVRPVKLFDGVMHKVHGKFRQIWQPNMVDMTILRENTEGLYHSLLKRASNRAQGLDEYVIPEVEFPDLQGEVVYDPRPISSHGTERLVKMGFEISKTRNGAPSDGVSRVSCIDKSNVTRGCQLFRRTFDKVAANYPDISTDYGYIDAFTQWITRTPEHYDVVVTSNMFGDIATDLASVLQGGMGMAGSGNIGDKHAFFEPVHGSAPKYSGMNKVNPIASVNSIQMMMDWLGRKNNNQEIINVASAIERSVSEHLKEGKHLTYDLGGDSTCSMVGDLISQRLANILKEN